MEMALSDLIPWSQGRNVPARTDATEPFVSLHREMNRLFDDFWRGFGAGLPGPGQAVAWPNVEIGETEKEVQVTAELPGLDDKDVELLLADNVLMLRGEKKGGTEDKVRHVSERFYGRFERQIPLGVEVEQDKVMANFRNGVLTVTLPKAPNAQAKAKRIPVNAA
jgi:HSP20 family protein